MASQFENWARTERECITTDLRRLRDGGKLFSPNGVDITTNKISELEGRLEHANLVIASIGRA